MENDPYDHVAPTIKSGGEAVMIKGKNQWNSNQCLSQIQVMSLQVRS